MPVNATPSPRMPETSVPSSGDDQIVAASQSRSSPVGSIVAIQSSEGRCHGRGPRKDRAWPDTLERYAAPSGTVPHRVHHSGGPSAHAAMRSAARVQHLANHGLRRLEGRARGRCRARGEMPHHPAIPRLAVRRGSAACLGTSRRDRRPFPRALRASHRTGHRRTPCSRGELQRALTTAATTGDRRPAPSTPPRARRAWRQRLRSYQESRHAPDRDPSGSHESPLESHTEVART